MFSYFFLLLLLGFFPLQLLSICLFYSIELTLQSGDYSESIISMIYTQRLIRFSTY